MEYYIQGDAAKADKIKAAFETKAIYSNLTFTNENYLYYSCDGKVNFCFIGGGLANIVKTHPDYKELELPVEHKLKVGDWIAGIDDEGDVATEKIVSFSHNKVMLLDTDGCHTEYPKTELSNFHLWTIADANDGDVLATDNGWTCIFKDLDLFNEMFSSYCFMATCLDFMPYSSECHTLDSRINGNIHPATKEQRDQFFKKMKEAGYTWDEEKKELKKKHYDIANFKPFDKVLVRCENDERWVIEFYCEYDTLAYTSPHRNYPFMGIGDSYSQCIPFEGNEHLLGTTDMPSEEYINW